jgi:predicted hydrocarbon binding protein
MSGKIVGDLTVTTELVLQIASAPGIQLRVVNRLKELGLICTRRTLKKTPFVDTRYLVLELDGPQMPRQRIIDQLRPVHGIISFDKLASDGGVSDEVLEEKKKPQPHQEIAPEAGDADIRDRMLVFSLLSRYPNLGGRLYEIMSSIPEDERLNRARQLGHSFGQHLFKQQKLSSPLKDLPDTLSRLILPAISTMTEAHLQEHLLAITSSKINIKPKKPQETSCQFLLGTLGGLLKAADQGIYRIEKICCAAQGAECCKFEFISG